MFGFPIAVWLELLGNPTHFCTVAGREDLDPGEIGGIARLRDELFKRRRDL